MHPGGATIARVDRLRFSLRQIIVNNSLQNGYDFTKGDVVTTHDFLDEPPGGAVLTAYDEAHTKLYLRLLDAEAQGADWTEVVRVVFGICPEAEPDRAARVHRTHLDRAKWMTQSGFCEFLGQRLH